MKNEMTQYSFNLSVICYTDENDNIMRIADWLSIEMTPFR